MANPSEPFDVEENESVNYKPPPEKSLVEILETDKDDESLRKYKETLLGSHSSNAPIVQMLNPNRVIVTSLCLITEGRPDLVLDLEGNHIIVCTFMFFSCLCDSFCFPHYVTHILSVNYMNETRFKHHLKF